MAHPTPPFPDDPARRDPRPQEPRDDAEFLLDLAAWLDGSLPSEDLPRLEARLAEDPHARALATSARLEPVSPEDLLEPLPAGIVARAAALRPAAGEPRPVVHRPAARDRAGHGGWTIAAFLRGGLAAAACLGAVLGGWQLGGSAGQPRTRPGTPPPAVAVAVATDESVDGDMLLAAASFGVFETPESSLEDALPLLAMLDGGSLGAIGLDGGLGR